jgi:hypothetical protein
VHSTRQQKVDIIMQIKIQARFNCNDYSACLLGFGFLIFPKVRTRFPLIVSVSIIFFFQKIKKNICSGNIFLQMQQFPFLYVNRISSTFFGKMRIYSLPQYFCGNGKFFNVCLFTKNDLHYYFQL